MRYPTPEMEKAVPRPAADFFRDFIRPLSLRSADEDPRHFTIPEVVALSGLPCSTVSRWLRELWQSGFLMISARRESRKSMYWLDLRVDDPTLTETLACDKCGLAVETGKGTRLLGDGSLAHIRCYDRAPFRQRKRRSVVAARPTTRKPRQKTKVTGHFDTIILED